MHPDYNWDTAMETVEGLLVPCYMGLPLPNETIRTLWGIAHWMRDMVHQLAGEG